GASAQAQIAINGTVTAGSDAALGPAGQSLIFNGGTLVYSAGFSSSRPLVFNAGGGTLDTNGHDASLSGTVSGNGRLTKYGNGMLVLTTHISTSLQFSVLVAGGTLQVAPPASLFNVFVAVAPTTTLDVSASSVIGGLAGSGNVKIGSGTLVIGNLDVFF